MRKVMVVIGALVALGAVAGSAVAADLPEIKKRGKLLAATSGNLLPVSYVNEKNELVGYDIEVVTISRRSSACRSTSPGSTSRASCRACRPAVSMPSSPT